MAINFCRRGAASTTFGDKECSFQEISAVGSHSFAYCCCISTWKAEQRIANIAPAVTLCSAHQLFERHSAVHQSSSIWQNVDAVSAYDVLRNASHRAGYCLENGGSHDWRGFDGLGLALAFSHGIPDACLPIFFSQRGNWKPLIVRKLIVSEPHAIHDLFGSFRAEWLRNDIYRLFSEPTYFPHLVGNKSCVLVGGRGSGKTTVLKCLSYEGQYELGKQDWALPKHVGVYYRVNTNYRDCIRWSGIGRPRLEKNFWTFFELDHLS